MHKDKDFNFGDSKCFIFSFLVPDFKGNHFKIIDKSIKDLSFMQLDSKPQVFTSHSCISSSLLSYYAGSGEQGEGAGAGSGERGTRSPGGGGAASLRGGAERGGACGAVSPDPESPLGPSVDESVANTLPSGAHADAHSRRTAGGERLGKLWQEGVNRGASNNCILITVIITESNHLLNVSFFRPVSRR